MGKAKRKRMPEAKRKDQIAHIAAEMFARKGFAGTTVKEIADRAGVSEPMIFKLFGSKDGLHRHLPETQEISQFRERFYAELARRAEADDDEGVCRLIAETVLKRHLNDDTFTRLSLFGALENHEATKDMFEEHVRPFFRYLADYIKRRAAVGAFADADPDVAARAFIGMLGYFIILRQLYDERGSKRVGVKRAAETFTRLFLNGIKKR